MTMANYAKGLRECVVALDREKDGTIIPLETYFEGNWSGDDLQIAILALRKGYNQYQAKRLVDIEAAKRKLEHDKQVYESRCKVAAIGREAYKKKKEAEAIKQKDTVAETPLTDDEVMDETDSGESPVSEL